MESIAAAQNDKSRRRVLFGAVALGAAAAGVGLGFWRRPAPLGDQGAMAPTSFWDASFDSAAGGALAMRAFQGKPLLINFWATWCPPCIDELPLIDAFYRQNAPNRWQVLGLAIDQPGAVRTFLGRVHFFFTFIFINGVFLPMFFQGMLGMHRRWYDGGTSYEISKRLVFGLSGLEWNHVISWSAWLLGLAQLPFIFNFFWSIWNGKKVSDNPWHATTLEWAAPSPPPHGNFTRALTVHRGPYEYSVPGAEEDYTPQYQPTVPKKQPVVAPQHQPA